MARLAPGALFALALGEALLVNPHDERSLQDTIVRAVEMHRHERRERMASLRETIRSSDVKGWAHRFLGRLAE